METIKIKRNIIDSARIPNSLELGELASNVLDTSLFIGNGSSVVKLYTHSSKYFNADGYANNAILLGGQEASYYATSAQITAINKSIGSANTRIDELLNSGVKNPNALTFGEKTYDGSAAKTITASDLGLGNVQNYGIFNQAAYKTGISYPIINQGTMEIADRIDFHSLEGSNDYEVSLRVKSGETTPRKIYFPATEGTLALTSQVESVNNTLNTHITAYNAFKTTTESSLINHNNRIATLENMFEWDGNGNIRAKANFYSDGGVSAGGYSHSSGGSGGTTIDTPYVMAGAVNGSSITSWSDANQSYAGSIQVNSTWYNLISVRHRNGESDGNSYGMVMYSNMTAVGNLIWRQRFVGGSGWGTERMILDSSNYTDYVYTEAEVNAIVSNYLPITGGTITNNLTVGSANTAYNVAGGILASGEIAGVHKLRVNAADNAGNYAFMRTKTYSDNRALLILGSCYGSVNGINDDAADYVAITTYKNTVGIGKLYEGTDLYTHDKNGVKLAVSGNVSATGTVTQGSDIRYKNVICDASVSVETIANAPLFVYKWADREDNNLHLGTSAQYWYGTGFNHAVRPNDAELWTMGYGEIAMGNTIVLAREQIKIKTEVEMLRERVNELENELKQYKHG